MLQVVSLLVALVCSVELTPSNYDELTAGKTVFIKHLAPYVRIVFVQLFFSFFF